MIRAPDPVASGHRPPAGDVVARLFAIAGELTGVQLDERHREMVKSRMLKRVDELGLPSLDAYLEYYGSHRGPESPHIVSLLTTHHSYFFRESAHFSYLVDTGLVQLLPQVQARPDRTLRVWSAACSRGQEVYSLAMLLDVHLRALDRSLNFTVLGTDIDDESLNIARNGVYRRSDLQKVPLSLLQDHWARGSGEISNYVKVRQGLRDHCRFARQNIFELLPTATETFDIIFCRNVFIYFNQEQIRQLARGLIRRLNPGGYFFVGISESLTQLKLPLRSVGPSIYQAVPPAAGADGEPAAAPGATRPAAGNVPVAAAARLAADAPPLLRVVCVDASPGALALLRQILAPEHGFEVVGTAANGREAAVQVSALRPAAITLDIHMPEMDGLAYLRQHFRAGHCPVIMVTAVSRDNLDLAGEALALGAADHVEKPVLSHLAECGEELCAKLRCAVRAQALAVPRNLAVDAAFQARLPPYDTARTLRVVVLPLSQRAALVPLFAELTGEQPPCVVMFDGVRPEFLAEMAKILSKQSGRQLDYAASVPRALAASSITLMDLRSQAASLAAQHGGHRRCSLVVYGEVSRAAATLLCEFAGAQILLEDLGGGRGTPHLAARASDVVAPSSFAYLSAHFLRKP